MRISDWSSDVCSSDLPIAPPELTLLASDGTPIARTGAIVETPIEVAKLPKHVTGAFLAIEDRRFYSHWGIDPRSIARALWNNMTSGRTQGGSTITQQQIGRAHD